MVLLPILQGLVREAYRDDAAPLNFGIRPNGENYPGITAWLKRVGVLLDYDKTYPPHWKTRGSQTASS